MSFSQKMLGIVTFVRNREVFAEKAELLVESVFVGELVFEMLNFIFFNEPL
jgi:hypothetical protein